MWKDAFRGIGVILGVSLIVAAIMRLSGVIEDFWFWCGIMAVLVLGPTLKWFLKKHFEMTGKAVGVILGVVYLVIIAVTYPYAVECFARKAPLTAEALEKRAVDMDARSAQRITPIGTTQRIVLLKHCSEREAMLAQWEADELSQVRKDLKAGKIKVTEAETKEGNIIKWKRDNLATLMKSCQPDILPTSTASSSWLGNLPDFRALAGVPTWFWGLAAAIALVLGAWLLGSLWRKKWGQAVVATALLLFAGGQLLYAGQQFQRFNYAGQQGRQQFQKVAAVTGEALTLPADTQPLVTRYAQQYGVPENFMAAVCLRESECNLNVKDGDDGEICAMQIRPNAAVATFPERFQSEELATAALRTPDGCLDTGARLLKEYLTRYKGDQRKTALAYNAGPGAADRDEYPGDSRQYVEWVIARAQGSRQPAVQTASARTFLTAVGSCRDDVSVHRLVSGKPDPVPELTTPKGFSRAFRARWGSDYVILREQDHAELKRIENARPLHSGELFVPIDCPGAS